MDYVAMRIVNLTVQDWGISSAGRAPALHAGGQRFDPAILHQFGFLTEKLLFFTSWYFVIISKYRFDGGYRCPHYASNRTNVLTLHWSSEQGSMGDALALSGDEGRDYLRKVSGSW